LSKEVFRSTLKPEERLLVQVQRSMVISSDSSDNVFSDADKINELFSEKPLHKLFSLGRINKFMKKNYQNGG
jgi:hypothetical protein